MYKRKITNYMIYPQFQLALLGANIVILLLILILIYLTANDVFNNLGQMGKTIGLPADHPYFDFVSRSRNIMNMRMYWTFGLSIILSFVSSILISHRLAGPIYKLRNYFLGIVNDKAFTTLKFRKKDYFYDLTDIVNEAVEKLKNNK